MEMHDGQIVQVREDGQAIVNDYPNDNPTALRCQNLETMLHRFRQASEANLVEVRITIAPNDKTPHEVVVKVMDACSHAGIENVTFAFAAGRSRMLLVQGPQRTVSPMRIAALPHDFPRNNNEVSREKPAPTLDNS